MQQELMTTITGRPLTVPATFRLPIGQYTRAREEAPRRGISLAKLFEVFVSEKLEEGESNSFTTQQPEVQRSVDI